MTGTIRDKNSLATYLKGLENIVATESCDLKKLGPIQNEIYFISAHLNDFKKGKRKPINNSKYDVMVSSNRIFLLSEKARKLKSRYEIKKTEQGFDLCKNYFGQLFRSKNSLILHLPNFLEQGNYNIDEITKSFKFTKV